MRPRLSPLPIALLLAALVGTGCTAASGLGDARSNLNNGEYDLALSKANEALATDPDNVDALVLKTEVYSRQYDALSGDAEKQAYLAQNFDDMVAAVRRIEALAPDGAEVRNARLNTWALAVNASNDIVRNEAMDASTAVSYLETANELVPDSTQGYLSLGLAYLRAGEAAQAVTPLERAVAIDADDSVLAYYYGRALLLADRPSEAVTVLEAAQTRFPDDTDIETMLLNAYTRSGNPGRATERYAAAVLSKPDDPTIRYNYGALLLQAGDFDGAVEQLQEATRLAPDNADAFYNLGAAYQNKAAQLNTQANDTEDTATANALVQQRNQNLELALPPLVQARTLATNTPDEQSFCEALFRVYTQLNRIDEATEVSECAGMSMN